MKAKDPATRAVLVLATNLKTNKNKMCNTLNHK